MKGKNREVIDSSGGLLPELHVEDIQTLTIAGSHTTTVLRLVDAAEHKQYKTSTEMRTCARAFFCRSEQCWMCVLHWRPLLQNVCSIQW